MRSREAGVRFVGGDNQSHRAGAQNGRFALLFFFLTEGCPKFAEPLENLLRLGGENNGTAHYGILQTWPCRASISSDAFGPQLPDA